LLLDRALRLIKHTDGRRAVTIVHGDAHVWNCFLPRDGGRMSGSSIGILGALASPPKTWPA
jgi:hypothetical protein